jgi:hypothetical protein
MMRADPLIVSARKVCCILRKDSLSD